MGEDGPQAGRRLSREVRSLIHHVELNKSGWWAKSVERIVVVTVWRSGPATLGEVADLLLPVLDGGLSGGRIEAALVRAESAGELITTNDGRYKVTEELDRELTGEWQAVIESEALIQERLIALAADHGVDADPLQLWEDFERLFMIPLISEAGARIYEVLTSGAEVSATVSTYGQIVEALCRKYGEEIRDVLIAFMDPSEPAVRAYVLRVLNADFVAEAAGLDQRVLDNLARSSGHPDRVRVFVDTNFLFSFLQLHDNPSNDIASDLIGLVERAKNTIKIEIFVLPITLDETRGVLREVMHQFSGVNTSRNMAHAARRVGSSGLVGRYLDAASDFTTGHLTAADFFGPYESNLVPILRDRGVELFNNSLLNELRVDQDVIDDIHDQEEFQAKFRERGAKPYEANLHDMVLWHFVRRDRPEAVDAPLEVGSWVCTVDFGLVSFDRHKRRGTQHPPVCVTPASLIQLLRFWAPRSEQLDRALVGSIREPLLFLGFDRSTENATVQILRSLSRFEGVGDLSESTIYGVLTNEALRSRVDSRTALSHEEENSLVEAAVLREVQRLERELEATRRQQNSDAADRDALVADAAQAAELRDQVERLGVELEGERDQKQAEVGALRSETAELTKRLAEVESGRQLRDQHWRDVWLVGSAAFLAAIVLATAAALMRNPVEGLIDRKSWVAWASVAIPAAACWLLLIDVLIRSRSTLKGTTFHQRLVRCRKGLVTILIAVAVGILATAIWEARA